MVLICVTTVTNCAIFFIKSFSCFEIISEEKKSVVYAKFTGNDDCKKIKLKHAWLMRNLFLDKIYVTFVYHITLEFYNTSTNLRRWSELMVCCDCCWSRSLNSCERRNCLLTSFKNMHARSRCVLSDWKGILNGEMN